MGGELLPHTNGLTVPLPDPIALHMARHLNQAGTAIFVYIWLLDSYEVQPAFILICRYIYFLNTACSSYFGF